MPTKREQLLDAAIDLLGSRGLRALTHRAVDDNAGMPAGSASNYFRTREALLGGISDRLEQRDYADWEALTTRPMPSTVDQVIDGATALIAHSVTDDRTRTLARYALFVEAQHMPALQQTVQRGHERLTAWVADMVRPFGAGPEVAKMLVDYFDGMILHQLTSPVPDFEPRAAVDRLVRALLT
ncbi:TetR/AcrR family transcriptional regulator [Nocardia sp. NPDC052566]|uniref:TetR/AcrR family transcriptional regulator n=1 Tax=Nocardia sp. NPDC052566 TaxID=3364330 RepID=UPI0037CA86E0